MFLCTDNIHRRSDVTLRFSHASASCHWDCFGVWNDVVGGGFAIFFMFHFHTIDMRHQRSREIEETVVDVFLCFGTCFDIFQSFLIRIGFHVRVGHRALELKIRLRSDEKYRRVIRTELVDFFEPVVHVNEAFLVRDIEADHHAMCASIERRHHTFEPILTCCVPHLQLATLGIDIDRADVEVYLTREAQ
jgi:hypothetical protein